MLTFVPAPIGNLADITIRGLEVLQKANIILCEDTRVTKKLLNLLSQKYNIDFIANQYISLHSHNEEQFLNSQTKSMLEDNNMVYLSDAGMPCISDPGAKLVDFCIKNKIKYEVLSGASAVVTAFAMSGFLHKEFLFLGFLPHKTKNKSPFIEQILQSKYPTIIYESPKRLLDFLEMLSSKSPNIIVFLAKEISKLYAKSYKDTAINLYNQLKNETIKGEWVIVVDGKTATKGEAITQDDIKQLSLPPKQKAKLLAKLSGKSIKEMYDT